MVLNDKASAFEATLMGASKAGFFRSLLMAQIALDFYCQEVLALVLNSSWRLEITK